MIDVNSSNQTSNDAKLDQPNGWSNPRQPFQETVENPAKRKPSSRLEST